MLDFLGEKGARPDSKMFTTLGPLPSFIDRSQPPTKKQPWRVINEAGFVRSVEIVLPDELYGIIWRKVEEELKPVKYARVIMKLQDLLDGDFFTEYIKKGNILMLSEGQPGVDNVFSLRDGILRLELDKETYERAGLQGQTCRGGGRKHVKARYLVEINIRQPSMLHGKKGFERVVWAAKNVLNRSLTWLFHDLRSDDGDSSVDNVSPLSKHHPAIFDFSPKGRHNPLVRVPPLEPLDIGDDSSAPDIEEWSYEIVEWLGLVALESPRVQANDGVDSHLSRWTFPAGTSEQPTQIRVLRWEGMVDPRWVTKLLITCIFHTKILPLDPSNVWLALTAQAHSTAALNATDGYSVLLTPDADQTQINTSILASEESVEREELNHVCVESNVKDAGRRRGLQRFACFQYSDSVVGY